MAFYALPDVAFFINPAGAYSAAERGATCAQQQSSRAAKREAESREYAEGGERHMREPKDGTVVRQRQLARARYCEQRVYAVRGAGSLSGSE